MPILKKLREKGYNGPLSVELFLPQFRDADPYQTAREIRQKCEPLMRRAGVLWSRTGRGTKMALCQRHTRARD